MRTLIEKINAEIQYLDAEIDAIDTILAYDHEEMSEARRESKQYARKSYVGERRAFLRTLEFIKEELRKDNTRIQEAIRLFKDEQESFFIL